MTGFLGDIVSLFLNAIGSTLVALPYGVYAVRATRNEGKQSFRGFLDFIPNTLKVLRKEKGNSSEITSYVMFALFVGLALNVAIRLVIWLIGFLIDYSLVVLILICLVGWGYYRYRLKLKEDLARNGNNAYAIMHQTVIDLAKEVDIFSKASERNVRKVTHSKHAKGDVKNHIYDGKILLLQGEFEEREVLTGISEKIKVLCEDFGYLDENREPMFELLSFYQQSTYIYYTIVCTENVATKIRFEELQTQRDKIEGYIDYRELQDDDY